MNRVWQAIQNEKKPLLGMAVYTYNPAFVEILGLLGFRVLWIEMEHAHITYSQAADLCRTAAGVGLLTMIRIPDARRDNVLKAAECGPDIIDLPMGNSPDTLREFVRHARYKPHGDRGFFGSSRAQQYGIIDSIVDQQELLNSSLCLMSQIETREAVACVDELTSVEGIDGIFIGPGDLSASLGVTGETGHSSVQAAIQRTIQVAKRRDKIVALAMGIDKAAEWAGQGVDIIFSGSDVSCMRDGARAVIDKAKRATEAIKAI